MRHFTEYIVSICLDACKDGTCNCKSNIASPLLILHMLEFTDNHRGPAHFWVDLGHILVEKKYILGEFFLPNIYFFRPICVPNQPKKRAGPLC